MATSKFQTTQYDAEHFVESAGAILFHVQQRQICLVQHKQRKEWLLAKGRRNVGESHDSAALREMTEETGFACDLLPLTMTTRAPPAAEEGIDYPDEPRIHTNVTAPFMFTCRQLDGGRGVKLIWWYIAAIRQSGEGTSVVIGDGEENLEAALFSFEDALAKLTYKNDQEVIKKAIEIFEANEGPATEK